MPDKRRRLLLPKQNTMRSTDKVVVVCGSSGAGKTSVINSILRLNKRRTCCSSDIFQDDWISVKYKDKVLRIEDIQQKVNTSFKNLTTHQHLIIELTTSLPEHDQLLRTLNHQYNVVYVLSPTDVHLPIARTYITTTLDMNHHHAWQTASQVLLAYQASPDTHTELSKLDNISSVSTLSSVDMIRLVSTHFPGLSTRALHYAVLMLSFLVDKARTRLRMIQTKMGNFLALYTQNVGLLIQVQIEQVQRMFIKQELYSGSMCVYFPTETNYTQMCVTHSNQTPHTLTQKHLHGLIKESSQLYYKYVNIAVRLGEGRKMDVVQSLITLIGIQEKISKDPDPYFILSCDNYNTLLEMIYKIQLNIPVIMCGRAGSGKSAVIRYLIHLYRTFCSTTRLIAHTPAQQTLDKLVSSLLRSSSSADVILVHVSDISTADELENIMELVYDRTYNGVRIPENARFLIESRTTPLDKHLVCSLTECDMTVCSGLLAMSGVPQYGTILGLLDDHDVRYNYSQIVRLSKLCAWFKDMYYSKYCDKLNKTTGFKVEFGTKYRDLLLLLVCVEVVFGKRGDLFADIKRRMLDDANRDLGCEYEQWFSVQAISSVIFSDIKCRDNTLKESIFELALSIETNIPLALFNTRPTFSAPALAHLLETSTLLFKYPCHVQIVDCTAGAADMLRIYTSCLLRQINSSKNTDKFQHSVLVIEDYDKFSKECRALVNQLLKRRAVHNRCTDIGIIVLCGSTGVIRDELFPYCISDVPSTDDEMTVSEDNNVQLDTSHVDMQPTERDVMEELVNITDCDIMDTMQSCLLRMDCPDLEETKHDSLLSDVMKSHLNSDTVKQLFHFFSVAVTSDPLSVYKSRDNVISLICYSVTSGVIAEFVQWESTRALKYKLRFPLSYTAYKYAVSSYTDVTIDKILKNTMLSYDMRHTLLYDVVTIVTDTVNQQIYESKYKILKELEKSRKDEKETISLYEYMVKLDKLVLNHSSDADLISCLSKIPPHDVTNIINITISQNTSIDKLLANLIRHRLLLIYNSLKWRTAYLLTNELKTYLAAASHILSPNLKLFIENITCFCEMSYTFCEIPDASLKCFLKICHREYVEKCSVNDLSSWYDNIRVEKVEVKLIIYLTQQHGLRVCRHLAVESLKLLTNVDLVWSLVELLLTYPRKDILPILEESLNYSKYVCYVLTNFYKIENTFDMRESMKCIRNCPTLTIDTLDHIITLRKYLYVFSDQIINFLKKENHSLATEDLYHYFEKDTKLYPVIELVCRTLSRSSSICIRRFILHRIVQSLGVACFNEVLKLLPILHFQPNRGSNTSVSNINSGKGYQIDYSVIISGYVSCRELVYPSCKVCSDPDLIREYSSAVITQVYVGVILQQGTNNVPCNCLQQEIPAPVLGFITTCLSVFRRNLSHHIRPAMYLTSHTFGDKNNFTLYFYHLLTLPTQKLDNMFWMVMFEDPLTVMRRIKLTEKFSGVDKELSYYVCPNKHVYSINNCGEPLERGICPDPGCNAPIGGEDHVSSHGNRKYGPSEKTMIETGYNLVDAKPGKEELRGLSKLSGAVLWYFTHIALMLRHTPFIPKIEGYNAEERLTHAFNDVSKTLALTPDKTVLFLLTLINTMCNTTTDTLYTKHTTTDGVEPQDKLVEIRNKELKDNRIKWEVEFDKIVTVTLEQYEEHSDVYKTLVDADIADRANPMLAHVLGREEIGQMIETPEQFTTDLLHHQYLWSTPKPTVSLKSVCKLSGLSESARKFVELEEYLSDIQYLPFLLDLVTQLQFKYNYKFSTYDLSNTPITAIDECVDITKWYELWIKLTPLILARKSALFPVIEVKSFGETTLEDIIPTVCGYGSATLNMIGYLSELQNKLAPPDNKTCTDPNMILSYTRDTDLPFICLDGIHLEKYLYYKYISHLAVLPTSTYTVLTDMSLLTFDTKDDIHSFVGFNNTYPSTNLTINQKDEINKCEDLEKLRRNITAIIMRSFYQDIHTDRLETLSDKEMDQEYNNSQKIEDTQLYGYWRYTLLVQSERTGIPYFDKHKFPGYFKSGEIVSSFLDNVCTKRSPDFCEDILLLLLEFIMLEVRHAGFIDPQNKVLLYSSWDLAEALRFYLDKFSNREAECDLIEEDVFWDGLKVDHIGPVYEGLLDLFHSNYSTSGGS